MSQTQKAVMDALALPGAYLVKTTTIAFMRIPDPRAKLGRYRSMPIRQPTFTALKRAKLIVPMDKPEPDDPPAWTYWKRATPE